jgi:hypothetical protein
MASESAVGTESTLSRRATTVPSVSSQGKDNFEAQVLVFAWSVHAYSGSSAITFGGGPGLRRKEESEGAVKTFSCADELGMYQADPHPKPYSASPSGRWHGRAN